MSVSPASTIDVDAIRDLFYPVGSYWISDNSTNPGTTIGGTWEQVKDTFLLAAGDNYAAGSNGGNSAHNHRYGIQLTCYHGEVGFYDNPISGVLNNAETAIPFTVSSRTPGTTRFNSSAIASDTSVEGYAFESVADTTASSNMPPYKAVYVFRRTA